MSSEARKAIANDACKRILNEYGFATCGLLPRSTPAISRRMRFLADGTSSPVDDCVAYVADTNAMQLQFDHKLFLIKEKDDSDASHVDQAFDLFATTKDKLNMEEEIDSGRGNVSSDMPLRLQENLIGSARSTSESAKSAGLRSCCSVIMVCVAKAPVVRGAAWIACHTAQGTTTATSNRPCPRLLLLLPRALGY
jgi:hypothetical protein